MKHKEQWTTNRSEDILRMKSDMNGQPDLKEKLEAEIERILEPVKRKTMAKPW